MCYVINDLTNRELIRKKFKFLHPVYGEDDQAPILSEDEVPYDPRLGLTDDADLTHFSQEKLYRKREHFARLDKEAEREKDESVFF